MRLILWALLGLTLLGQPVLSDETALRALQTADDGRGWEAVGRLNLGDTGFCTASLVTPDVVLTAAHCLFYKHNGARIAAQDIEFLAGLRNGRAEAQRGVRRIVLHPSYDFDGHNELDRVGNDIALIELDRPIRTPSVRPFQTQLRIERGQEVQVVSYAKDRANVPSMERACQVLTRDQDVMVLSCSVDFGASGAPVFKIVNGEARIVSVISAKAEWQNQPVALAAVMEGEMDVLIEAFRLTPPIGPEIRSVETASSDTLGARFVRP